MRVKSTALTITSLLAGLSILSATVPGIAAPVKDSDLLFHCSFDNTNEPNIHGGADDFRESAPSIYIPGRKGQALLTSHYRGISYAVSGNIQANEGTIIFWVMPFNWKGVDQTFHHFFQLSERRQSTSNTATGKERDFSVLLYKFPEWPVVVAHGMGGELTGDRLLRIQMDPIWAPKIWHQIAFTWDKDGSALYVDGIGQTMRYREDAPTRLGADRFRVGGPYFAPNASLTAIDELRIYKRKLSPEEIKEKYQIEKEN